MRRFNLTYTREGHAMEVEGALFSTGGVALEPYPDDEYPCPRSFVSFTSMEYTINEFGDASVEWIDKEPEREPIPVVALDITLDGRKLSEALLPHLRKE